MPAAFLVALLLTACDSDPSTVVADTDGNEQASGGGEAHATPDAPPYGEGALRYRTETLPRAERFRFESAANLQVDELGAIDSALQSVADLAPTVSAEWKKRPGQALGELEIDLRTAGFLLIRLREQQADERVYWGGGRDCWRATALRYLGRSTPILVSYVYRARPLAGGGIALDWYILPGGNDKQLRVGDVSEREIADLSKIIADAKGPPYLHLELRLARSDAP